MHRLAQGADIRTVQGLHEHSDVKTTMVVTPQLNRGPSGAQGPPICSEAVSNRTSCSRIRIRSRLIAGIQPKTKQPQLVSAQWRGLLAVLMLSRGVLREQLPDPPNKR
jgi:hypothetical protein